MFIHSLIEGYLDCFQILVVMNTHPWTGFCVNISLQFIWINPRSTIAGLCEQGCIWLCEELPTSFPAWLCRSIPTSNAGELLLLRSLPYQIYIKNTFMLFMRPKPGISLCFGEFHIDGRAYLLNNSCTISGHVWVFLALLVLTTGWFLWWVLGDIGICLIICVNILVSKTPCPRLITTTHVHVSPAAPEGGPGEDW